MNINNFVTLHSTVERIKDVQSILRLTITDLIYDYLNITVDGIYSSERNFIAKYKQDKTVLLFRESLKKLNNDYTGSSKLFYNYVFASLTRNFEDLNQITDYFRMMILWSYTSSKISPSIKYNISIKTIDPTGIIVHIFMNYIQYLILNETKTRLFVRSLPTHVVVENTNIIRREIGILVDKYFIDNYKIDIDVMINDIKTMSEVGGNIGNGTINGGGIIPRLHITTPSTATQLSIPTPPITAIPKTIQKKSVQFNPLPLIHSVEKIKYINDENTNDRVNSSYNGSYNDSDEDSDNY